MKTALVIAHIVVLVACANSQDSTHPAAPARLYTVHIDEVTLSSMQRFEQLSNAQMRARNKILEEHNLPLTPGYEISTSGGMYFSFRPRTMYGELDTPPQYSD